ncbi:MAG: ATP-binding protein [Elusimicrobia bacterium]|nr:ATP-binding protein [Elusimicrobiota bacterium]
MKLKIATKINLLIVSVIIIFGCVLGFYFIQKQKTMLTFEMDKRINALIMNLSNNSEYPVLVKDKMAISKLVKGLFVQKDIIYCRIEDKNGNTLYEEGLDKEKDIKTFVAIITTEDTKKSSFEDIMLDSNKSEGAKEELGKAILVVSLKEFNHELNRLKMILVFTIIFFVILASLVSYLFVKFVLDEPVNQLVFGTRKIADGILDWTVPVKTQDEIGELTVAFNKMTKDLSNTLVSKKDLKQALDNTRTLLEQIPIGLMIVGKDRKIRKVNSVALKMFGAEAEEEFLGKDCHNYLCKIGLDKCPILDLGNKVDNSEAILLTKTGQKTPILKNVRLINLEGEEVLLETFIDISERKKAEEEKDKLQKQLLQMDKMAAIGQLAGGVAHEINNPMGVILGFAQSIVRDIKEGDLLYMPLKSIEREAIRCKKLVGDLLTFSRIGKTEKEISNINGVIEQSVSLIEAQAKVKNVQIIKSYGDNLPQIVVNKNQIQQVIVNLCNNAMDAMPKGGSLTITTSQITADKKSVVISVTDTGDGMTEEVRKHIFEPFYTTKEVGKGTGLGLSLVYEVIQKHNGTIEVESEVGKGTTFRVKLPMS